MKKIHSYYLSRKTAIVRLSTVIIISFLSALINPDTDYKLWFGLSGMLCLLLLFIFRLFWKGYDDGKFSALFSNQDLIARDIVIKYSTILLLYIILELVAISVLFDSMINYYIIVSVMLLFAMIADSVLYFFSNKHNT